MVKSVEDTSSKRATVRWQENIGRDVYEVGLEYMRYLLDLGLHSQGTPHALSLLEVVKATFENYQGKPLSWTPHIPEMP